MTAPTDAGMVERKRKYRDFSDMPADELRALANMMSNPKESLRKIRDAKLAALRTRSPA